MSDEKKLLCLITGASGSGKTSIASNLKENILKNVTEHRFLNGEISSQNRTFIKIVLLHQDNYFTKPFLPYIERKDDSYENHSGIDWDRLMTDIQLHASSKHRVVIIVEGHLLGDATAKFQQFENDFDTIAVLVTCQKDTCKRRRLERRYRNEDEKNVLANYIDTFVWPSFLKYGVDAMHSLRTPGIDSSACENSNGKSTILEIDSETSSLTANVEEILNHIYEILDFMGK